MVLIGKHLMFGLILLIREAFYCLLGYGLCDGVVVQVVVNGQPWYPMFDGNVLLSFHLSDESGVLGLCQSA